VKKLGRTFQRKRKAAAYAVSMVIITAVTVSLIVVASSYAYQIIRQQRGAAEFDIAKKSLLAFDDALENVAFKHHAARSARFNIAYGRLELVDNATTLTVNVTVDGYENFSKSIPVDFVRYCTKTSYVSFGNGYKSYILGDESLISNGSTQGLGRAYIEERAGWVNITLYYGVQVFSSVDQAVEDSKLYNVTYVNIYVIRVNVNETGPFVFVGDFDLVARCTNVTSSFLNPDDGGEVEVSEGAVCTVTVQMGSNVDSTSITISRKGKVVVNLVEADVEVGP